MSTKKTQVKLAFHGMVQHVFSPGNILCSVAHTLNTTLLLGEEKDDNKLQ